MPSSENSVDPDQLASDEASCSGSTLVFNTMYRYEYRNYTTRLAGIQNFVRCIQPMLWLPIFLPWNFTKEDDHRIVLL